MKARAHLLLAMAFVLALSGCITTHEQACWSDNSKFRDSLNCLGYPGRINRKPDTFFTQEYIDKNKNVYECGLKLAHLVDTRTLDDEGAELLFKRYSAYFGTNTLPNPPSNYKKKFVNEDVSQIACVDFGYPAKAKRQIRINRDEAIRKDWERKDAAKEGRRATF